MTEMTRDKYHYWYFKNIIGSKTCDDIIRLASEKKPKLAETNGYKQKLVSKKYVKEKTL